MADMLSEYIPNKAVEVTPTSWHSGCDKKFAVIPRPPCQHPDRQLSGAPHRGRSIKKRSNRNGIQEMEAKEMKKQESVEDVVFIHLIQALSLDNHNIEPSGSPKPRQVGAG